MGNFFIRSYFGYFCITIIFLAITFSFLRDYYRREGLFNNLLKHIFILILLFVGSVNLSLPAFISLQSHLSEKYEDNIFISNVQLHKLSPLTLQIYTITTSTGDEMYLLDRHIEHSLNKGDKLITSGKVIYTDTILGKSIIKFQ